ncbi:MAG TPA: hypothetical protein VFV66_12700 [Nonomuraea sp.]|nr:hypothetical protein [Nonomuraea sp.]
MDVVPVDVRVHSVPADAGVNEPAHVHADFRYAFWADDVQMFSAARKRADFAGWPPLDLPTPRHMSGYEIRGQRSIPN